ncbi:hypothetical protein MW887_011946 [Aspergillus wentii]|nr:hypothetical protein MW887_011946 [Aspergillus wentii]
MSSPTGLPYLQKLLKSQLADFAEAADLQDYGQYNKPELATALDEHLRSNRSIFANDERFAEYYRRLSQPPRFSSPVKREAKVEITSPREEAPRSIRRRQTRLKEEEVEPEPAPKPAPQSQPEPEPTDDSDAGSLSDVKSPSIRTPVPARSPLSVQPPLPPSPAVVTDAIDHHTAVWRQNINDAWTASGVCERSHALRSMLSSVKAVQILVLALEGFSLTKEILPLRYLTTVPAVEAIHSPEFVVKVPDLFVLVDGVFWAPFSLWLLTSLFLPLSVAYFFNISLQNGPTPAPGTCKDRSEQASFDPLSFNIAKALIAYLVYGKNFTFWDLYSNFSVDKVNASVPGQWAGIITGAAVGGVGTFYEAILRK